MPAGPELGAARHTSRKTRPRARASLGSSFPRKHRRRVFKFYFFAARSPENSARRRLRERPGPGTRGDIGNVQEPRDPRVSGEPRGDMPRSQATGILQDGAAKGASGAWGGAGLSFPGGRKGGSPKQPPGTRTEAGNAKGRGGEGGGPAPCGAWLRVRTATPTPAQHSAGRQGAHGEPPPGGRPGPSRGPFPARPPPAPRVPAQALQPVHGGRQGGDGRQAPGGRLAAEKRLHDGRRPGRGAAGEEQAAAVRGLRAQFHGRARPPRGEEGTPAPSASAAPVRPVGTGLGRAPRRRSPRLKHKHDPAVPGRGCRGGSGADGQAGERASVRPQQAPTPRTGASRSPREASGRAPATWRLNPNNAAGRGGRAAAAERPRPGPTASSRPSRPSPARTPLRQAAGLLSWTVAAQRPFALIAAPRPRPLPPRPLSYLAPNGAHQLGSGPAPRLPTGSQAEPRRGGRGRSSRDPARSRARRKGAGPRAVPSGAARERARRSMKSPSSSCEALSGRHGGSWPVACWGA